MLIFIQTIELPNCISAFPSFLLYISGNMKDELGKYIGLVFVQIKKEKEN